MNSPQVKRAMVRLLKRVYKRLDSERYGLEVSYRYICIALSYVVNAQNTIESEAAYRLRTIIATRLGRHGILEEWLMAKRFLSRRWERKPLPPELMERCKATRLAWIDDLIKEFSK